MIIDVNKEERKGKILEYLNEEEYIPLTKDELRIVLSVPEEDKQAYDELIDEMLAKGLLWETKKKKLMIPDKVNIFAGTFMGTAKGFGFVVTDNEFADDDIFIPPGMTGGAMHRDKVLCMVNREKYDDKRREGEVIKILERGMEGIVGTFEETENGSGIVIPDDKKIDKDIVVAAKDKNGAVTGHKVVVKVDSWPEGKGEKAEGRILEILGHVNDPGVDILSIIYQYGFPIEFPEAVMKEVESMPDSVSPEEMEGREDLRDVMMVTIDGEDAKDLDDAVSLSILDNKNYLLGVHIADVSNYVREGTALDEDAFDRGTSVYLVDRVIPMLPHKLSNGICSLNEGVDRLALSCIMEITPDGKVIDHRVVNSVIHSNRRMNYTDVNKILTYNDEELIAKYKELVPMFREMEQLCLILNEKREERGSVNFEIPESKIILDENGKIAEIKPYDRNIATRIIEEFMLICNETIAEDFFWQDIPFVYRTHEAPDESRVEALKEFLKNFGYRIKGKGELRPKAVQTVIKQAEGTPEENIINRVVLRSMKRAAYMAENRGHFGLAATYYCHFTSPIRRYPDLQIHRLIKERLAGGFDPERETYLRKALPFIAKHSSIQEQMADEAERDTDNLKKAEFMQDKIGEVYPGIISGVSQNGFFVELENTVEGMVSLDSFEDDRYAADVKAMTVTGHKHKKTYKLGDKVWVKCVAASTETKKVDFAITTAPVEE